jgi:hypothetical protein
MAASYMAEMGLDIQHAYAMVNRDGISPNQSRYVTQVATRIDANLDVS